MPETEELVRDDENVIWIGETGFEAYGEQLIALVDEFRSGYECTRCLAKDIRKLSEYRMVSVVPCDNCGGTRRYKTSGSDVEKKCSQCEELGGVIPCPDCGGRGGLVATPQSSEGAPTTGRLVSVGPHANPAETKTIFMTGHRVMFSSYAGHNYSMKAKLATGEERLVAIRFLVPKDILCRLYGVLEYKNSKGLLQLHTNQ